eukprot:8050691-Alexandrium_andersonii.AAC.1
MPPLFRAGLPLSPAFVLRGCAGGVRLACTMDSAFDSALDHGVQPPPLPPAPSVAVKTEPEADSEVKREVTKTLVNQDTYKQVITTLMHEQLEKWHGPVQYLQRKYNTRESMRVLAEHLRLAYPPRDDVAYLQDGQLP